MYCFCRLTGAQGILLFYNYLPDKCLVVKPNQNRNNCVKIESLTTDILDAARKIIIHQQKNTDDKVAEFTYLEDKVVELTSSNQKLHEKVECLEMKIDEQNKKLDLLLRRH